MELVEEYLGGFHVEGASDEFRFSADCGLSSTLPGGKSVRPKLKLFFGTLKIYDGTEPQEMAGRLIAGVRDLATQYSNEFVRLRAGGVAFGDHSLLFPTAPDPRLPALVAALVRSGGAYLGDEIVNIEPVLRRLHPLRLPLLLDRDDIPAFPELGREPRRSRRRLPLLDAGQTVDAKGPRWPVRLDEIEGRIADPLPPRSVLFPTFQAGGPSEIREIASSEALFRITEATLNLHVWQERGLILLRQLVESARIGRLIVGSIPEAVELVTAYAEDGEGR